MSYMTDLLPLDEKLYIIMGTKMCTKVRWLQWCEQNVWCDQKCKKNVWCDQNVRNM